MQGYQQRLILFALSIIVTSADTTINFFDAVLETNTVNNQSTVFANHIQLVNLYFLVHLTTVYQCL